MEFWQIIIGTLSGFIVAFLAEPVKTYFETHRKKTQLRRALYGEILSVYVSMYDFLSFLHGEALTEERFMRNIQRCVMFDCYNYAKTDPTTFYQLPEATIINTIYRNFRLLAENPFENDKQRIEYTKMALSVIERNVENGELDKNILFRVASNARAKKLLKSRFPSMYKKMQPVEEPST
jgi:hypothetical protein